MALDQAGVACSTGSACASGASDVSPVHVAMGCDAKVAESALRFSFGANSTLADAEEAAERVVRIAVSMKRR
jgi:cysteine desulfurase